jgi:hypothetical protein
VGRRRKIFDKVEQTLDATPRRTVGSHHNTLERGSPNEHGGSLGLKSLVGLEASDKGLAPKSRPIINPSPSSTALPTETVNMLESINFEEGELKLGQPGLN